MTDNRCKNLFLKKEKNERDVQNYNCEVAVVLEKETLETGPDVIDSCATARVPIFSKFQPTTIKYSDLSVETIEFMFTNSTEGLPNNF